MSDDKLDPDVACAKLNDALRLQYRCAIGYAVAGGSLRGLEYQALGGLFGQWAAEELSGAQLLVSKVVALGGEPIVEPSTGEFEADALVALRALIATERESIAALHAVIPDTGQEPRSEALEHLLEHEIMRKQHHLDTLFRAVGGVEDRTE